MEHKTPLFDQHKAQGGILISYAGYMMPVSYAGIVQEHMAVRKTAGLFDVSHMGKIVIRGRDALLNLNYICTNDFSDLAEGSVRYSLICNEKGGVVDDILVYRISHTRYLIVSNAANRQKVFKFIASYLQGSVRITDDSVNHALLALQGPKSRGILARLTDDVYIPSKYYTFTDGADVAGVACLISQTGYTGERGYEILCSPERAEKLWRAILGAGKCDGIIPCGLGARDTLRLEASMPLYGHEISEEITPFEAGLAFAVKMSKADFIGKKALETRVVPDKVRAGLRVTGKGIIRENYPVFNSEKQIGTATSGTYLHWLGGAYAMALLDASCTNIGNPVEAEVRGRRVSAEIIPLPFYKRKEKKNEHQ